MTTGDSLLVFGVRSTVRDMSGIQQGEEFEYVVIDVFEGTLVFHRTADDDKVGTTPVWLTIAVACVEHGPMGLSSHRR